MSDLPWAARILPPRLNGWGKLLIGLAVVTTAASAWRGPHALAHGVMLWAMLGSYAALATLLAVRAVLELPLIEASELGIAIWLHGPYRRPFFAAWPRVRAIVLTRAQDPGGRLRDALGIELIQDREFRLPSDLQRVQIPSGAPAADLAWSNADVRGDLRGWVELLQRMKAAAAESPFVAPEDLPGQGGPSGPPMHAEPKASTTSARTGA